MKSVNENKRFEGYYKSPEEKDFLENKYKIDNELYGNIEIDEVLDFLYLGDFWSCRAERALKKRKIELVINCTDEEHSEKYKYAGIEYLQFTMRDSEDQDIMDSAEKIFKVIEECRSMTPPRHIYIHCHEGVSRSASMVIAYLIKKRKCSYEEAYNIVNEKRPCINPNPGFIRQLKKMVL